MTDNKISPELQFLLNCRDPFFFIESMWGLKPQPAKPEFEESLSEMDAVTWTADMFGNSSRVELDNGSYYIKWEWYDGADGWIKTRDEFLAKGWFTWQQRAMLEKIREHIKFVQTEEEARQALKEVLGWVSVSSGHGIGKSAFLSFIILWFLFCFPFSQVAATAPSKQQIHDVLWKEVSIWISRMPEVYKAQYNWQKGHLRMNYSPEKWFARAATASKENPEALAGVHGEHVLLVADEASGVEQIIFETAEGAMTGGHTMFIMISNPTRNIGYFKNSFKKDSADWINFSFNSEESPVVDVAYVEKMARKYSREEDNYKIRVLGLFPADDEMDDKGYMPLISEKLLRDAFIPADTPFKARRLGVDPAAAGSDPAVWTGLNTNMIKILAEEKISTPSSGASKTLTLAKEHDIVGKYINLDSFGDGADWLPFINRAGLLVDSFRSSEPSTNKDYQNKRAEGAWKFRKFLLQGGQVVYDERWLEVLNILYRTNIRGQIQIMPKKDMKKLRIPSPNVFDSGTYCFVGKEVSAEATIDAQNKEMQRLEQIVRGNQLNRFG